MIVEQIWTNNAWRNFNYLIACPKTGDALAIDPLDYQQALDIARKNDWRMHGVDVVVDDMSIELIDHAELDYVQDLMGSYFAVTNPNATASCGCGTSFSV